jgi:NAD+ kinase
MCPSYHSPPQVIFDAVMPREFQNIALTGLFTDSRVAEPMQAIAGHLTKRGVAVLSSPESAREIGTIAAPESEFAERVDLIIAVGGDGTMLYAASLVNDLDVPLLGVNRGRLGFLADVSPAATLDVLDQILEGNYSIESRLRLKATLATQGGTEKSAVGLNDVVLQRRNTGRMLDFDAHIAGRYVNTHMGDGLIVATPTGSTAYALSCGGPIIEPQLDAIVMVPICPHTLSDRPVVIPAAHSVEVSLREREDTNAEITVDGHFLGELLPTDRLTISSDATRISLIHPPGYDYYEILRSKLHWGRDSRKRNPGDRV